MTGKIVKIISNDCTVLVNDKLYICKPRGKFRINNLSNKLLEKSGSFTLVIITT